MSYQKIPRSLWSEDLLLLEKDALQVAQTAYAPYSLFRVGAALLLDSGKIVGGSNQENAAYPSGLCAERVALFSANSHFPNQKIVQMVLLALDKEGNRVENISPCGACRQVILEVVQRQKQSFSIAFLSGQMATIIEDCRNLLPFSFDGQILSSDKNL